MSQLKETLYFIKSRTFIFNVALAGSILVFLLSLIYLGLGNYTNHGESITVPNFIGVNPNLLDEFVKDKNLRYKIVDSIYNPREPQGAIVEQEPRANAKVKEGRTIYLTINSQTPPQIKMPNLIDVSDRQAEAIMQTYDLKIGQKIYRPDLAKNAVLDQLLGGHSIKPGTLVRKGAVIDLVLGDGVGNTKVNIPKLIGLSRDEAFFVLQGSALSLGAVIYDETVKDTLNARVYKQRPEFLTDNTINQGESVDLYFTESEEKLKTAQGQ